MSHSAGRAISTSTFPDPRREELSRGKATINRHTVSLWETAARLNLRLIRTVHPCGCRIVEDGVSRSRMRYRPRKVDRTPSGEGEEGGSTCRCCVLASRRHKKKRGFTSQVLSKKGHARLNFRNHCAGWDDCLVIANATSSSNDERRKCFLRIRDIKMWKYEIYVSIFNS